MKVDRGSPAYCDKKSARPGSLLIFVASMLAGVMVSWFSRSNSQLLYQSVSVAVEGVPGKLLAGGSPEVVKDVLPIKRGIAPEYRGDRVALMAHTPEPPMSRPPWPTRSPPTKCRLHRLEKASPQAAATGRSTPIFGSYFDKILEPTTEIEALPGLTALR